MPDASYDLSLESTFAPVSRFDAIEPRLLRHEELIYVTSHSQWVHEGNRTVRDPERRGPQRERMETPHIYRVRNEDEAVHSL